MQNNKNLRDCVYEQIEAVCKDLELRCGNLWRHEYLKGPKTKEKL